MKCQHVADLMHGDRQQVDRFFGGASPLGENATDIQLGFVVEPRRELSILLVIARGRIGEKRRFDERVVVKNDSTSSDACRIPAYGYLILNLGKERRAQIAPAKFDRDIPVPVDILEDLFPLLRRNLENLLEVSTTDYRSGLLPTQEQRSNF